MLAELNCCLARWVDGWMDDGCLFANRFGLGSVVVWFSYSSVENSGMGDAIFLFPSMDGCLVATIVLSIGSFLCLSFCSYIHGRCRRVKIAVAGFLFLLHAVRSLGWVGAGAFVCLIILGSCLRNGSREEWDRWTGLLSWAKGSKGNSGLARGKSEA